jgi:hypothetical protein
MRASVHGVDLQRRIERQKPQRNVMGARTNVEDAGSARQMFMDGRGKLVAPPRAIPERCDRVAFVVIGWNIPKNFRDQIPPGFSKEMRTKVFPLQEIF